MAKKFHPSLIRAWAQYQDLHDRHMRLLRRLGEAEDPESVKDEYRELIDYAMNQWASPQERWQQGSFDDLDWGMED